MAATDRPDWMVPGAPVVEFTRTGVSGHTARIVPTTIDCVLKRDLVLANGHRYNADNPRRRNGSWEPSTEVLPADDPLVAQAIQANRRSNTKSKALKSIDTLRAAINRMDPHQPLNMDLATLVDDARDDLARLLAVLPSGDD